MASASDGGLGVAIGQQGREEEAGSKTEETENKLEPASTSASTSHHIEAPPTATNGCSSTSTS